MHYRNSGKEASALPMLIVQVEIPGRNMGAYLMT